MKYRRRIVKSRQKTKYIINGVWRDNPAATKEHSFSLILNTTVKPNNFGRFLLITKRECSKIFMGIDMETELFIKMIQRLEK